MKRSIYFLRSQTPDSAPKKIGKKSLSATNLLEIPDVCEETSRHKIRLGDEFFNQESSVLARELLGKVLVRKLQNGERLCGRIVETEAYLGPIDKAAHSSCQKSVRTEPMFMKPGTTYVYSIYGMYHCMNVSSGGEGAAVLFRALEPITGMERMRDLRCSRQGKERKIPVHQLCNGPSKLCLSYGIDKSFNKSDLASISSTMWLEDWADQSSYTTVTSTRIGLSKKAENWIEAPLRFYIKGCKSLNGVLRDGYFVICARIGLTKLAFNKMCPESNSRFIDNVWESVRGSFVQEVLSDDHKIISVPKLSSANYFDSYFLFIKSKSESLGKKLSLLVAPNYEIVGHVSQVINLQKTDLNRLLNTSKPLDEETIQKEKWECHVELNNRSVHLTLEGIQKTTIPVIMEKGDLHLNTKIPELAAAKSVYIITDVVKASNITASVSDNNDRWERISLGSRPIAFGYAKFRLGHEGVVAEQVRTNPCPSGKWEVIMDRLTGFLNVFDD